MTFHGTSRASLENAVTRAIRREAKAEQIGCWHAKVRRHVKHTDAYQQAVEDNARLGLAPTKATAVETVLKLHKTSKRPVTLPGQVKEIELDERTQAEDRTIEAFKEAISWMSFHLTALSQIPNPSRNYRNRVNQKYLVDLVSQLSRALNIPSTFNEEISKPRVPLTQVCIDCGGPGCIEKRGHWYCEDCA
jgi:hypothetical protein